MVKSFQKEDKDAYSHHSYSIKYWKSQPKQLGKKKIIQIRIEIVKLSLGVPVMAQWLMNPTRNHGVVSSIPGLTQWVKDLVLPLAVVQVAVAVVQARSYSSDLTSSLVTSICHRCDPKKQKNKPRKHYKTPKILIIK